MLSSGQTLSLQGVDRELGWVPSFLRAKAALGLRLHQTMQADFLGDMAHRDPFVETLAGADLKGRSRLDQASYLWSKSALCNYILQTLGDGCEMAHSVEGRLPFLDHEFVALVARLPLDWKIRKGVEKWVLREAMRPLLPHSIINRRKHPFMAPPLSLSSDRLAAALREAVGEQRLPFCDPQRLLHQLERVAGLAEAEKREWDPVWMWLLTAHYLQRSLGLR
jgi:asparagine synthase (glutamine-hydrolysing)